MSEVKQCPECGAEMPSGALARLCPRCLLAVGLERPDDRDRSLSGELDAPTTPHSGSFVPPPPAELAAHFPHLEILDLVGYGGMGAVYRARQRNLDRLVALKIIRPESANTPSFAERFYREARLLARLNHPHIVAVYDFGRVDIALPAVDSNAEHAETTRPLFYFLMEFVDGANLRELLRDGDLTPPQALSIVPQICEALQFAHDEGIVHRDIKPENILLDKRGRVKIADFGLAKLAAGSTEDYSLTGTHQVMGTPRYMAPEQMEGSHAVDHRADIYSLGVVFYEMLTGEIPAGHFEPPSKKVEIDVRLDEVVLRSLAREPERRYQQAGEIKSKVDAITTKREIDPAPAVPHAWPYWTPSWKLYAASSLIFTVALHTLFTAIYSTTFGLSGTSIVAAFVAISACALFALAIEKLPLSAGKSGWNQRNLPALLMALLMLLTPAMVLSPVELKDWLPVSIAAITDREAQWLRILGWGLLLWTFYFTSAHVWARLAQLTRAGGREKDVDDAVDGGLIRQPERRYQHASAIKSVAERRQTHPIGMNPSPGSPTGDEAEDFLLKNPRLPVAAQWITVYAIVIRPVLWMLAMLLVVLGLEASLDSDNTETVVTHVEAVIDHAIDIVAGIFQLAFVVIVAVGGFKLCALRRGAVGWLQLGLALGVGLGLLVFILQLTFTPLRSEILREIARTNPAQLRADHFTQQEIDAILTDREYPILVPEVIGAFIGFSWFILDIVVITWLWRNGGRLPLTMKVACTVAQAERPLARSQRDEPALPRGTLRRAWDDCWAERDRTLTLFVQTTMGLTFAFCLIAFLSFHVNIKNVPDAKGQPIRHTIVVCGQSSSPWFRLEMNPAGNPGGKWEIILSSWSLAIMLAGFVAWGVMWEIEKARQKAVGKQPRWWNGSPILALLLWALGTTISLVAAFVMVSL